MTVPAHTFHSWWGCSCYLWFTLPRDQQKEFWAIQPSTIRIPTACNPVISTLTMPLRGTVKPSPCRSTAYRFILPLILSHSPREQLWSIYDPHVNLPTFHLNPLYMPGSWTVTQLSLQKSSKAVRDNSNLRIGNTQYSILIFALLNKIK